MYSGEAEAVKNQMQGRSASRRHREEEADVPKLHM